MERPQASTARLNTQWDPPSEPSEWVMTLPPKKEKKIIKERRKGIKLKFDDPHPSCLDPFVDHTDFDTQILLICSSQNITSLNWIWMVPFLQPSWPHGDLSNTPKQPLQLSCIQVDPRAGPFLKNDCLFIIFLLSFLKPSKWLESVVTCGRI